VAEKLMWHIGRILSFYDEWTLGDIAEEGDDEGHRAPENS